MDNQIISTCSLTKELVAIERKSPWSFYRNSTYTTVNTCTGQEVDRYEIKEVTALGGGITAVGLFGIAWIVIIFLTWLREKLN